jgi:hypothetical protein
MIATIALTPIFGKPTIMYGGLITLILLVITAVYAWGGVRGYWRFSLKWHASLAGLTIVFALFHGLLGLAMAFGF